MLAVLFGALIHDYEHTGNQILSYIDVIHVYRAHKQLSHSIGVSMSEAVKAKHEFRSNFALLYNDRSVLENHHVSACFRLLKDEDKNIFERLTRDEFR